MKVSLSSIRENPVALRGVDREGEQYRNLKDAVAKLGIMNPINVREKTDGETEETYYEICDGLHRFSCAKDLGLDEIPVNVLDIDESEVLEAQIIGNLARVDTKPIEYTKQLQRMMTMNPLMTIADVAEKVCQSPQWVSQRLGLLKLDSKIQEYVDDNKIGVSNAFALSKLPKEEQAAFVDAAMTMPPGEFVPTVNARKKEIQEAARKGREANPVEWSATPFLRKLKEFKDEHESGASAASVCAKADAQSAVEGFRAGVAWALHMDPDGVEAQKAKYEARQAEREDAKKKREAEKAKKKAEEAAKAAEEATAALAE